MFHQANNNFERRARLAHLVLCFFPVMMRDFLVHCMNIKRLFQIYCNDKRNPSILTFTELNLITELPSVENFTIQLCYKFISYEELLPEPSNGWGKFPDGKALALEDDIERIRHVVNEIIAVKDGECTQDYFVKTLYKVEPIIKRFQIALGRKDVILAYNNLLTQKIDTAEVLYEFENMCYISASDIQQIKLQDLERFSKISIAVTDILPEILRNIIQSRITPTAMYSLCINCTYNWTPSEKSQINTLNFSDSYKSLDASLLYKLLRMFPCIKIPTQGWGKKPTANDLRISDDIERIRILRNKAAHSSNTRVDQGDFDDYFLQFHEIAQRRSMDVDNKLTEIETTSLNPQKQIDKEMALKELEDIKERFEKFPVKYFWGRKFESKIKEIRQSQQGKEKIPIVVKLPVSDKAEMRARILNEFKDEINKDRLNIEFLEAVTGSLMIYADMYTEIMKTDESLQLELTSFMTRILHQGRYEIKCTQWMEAVIFLVEGNIEIKIDSSVEKSLSLHFSVNMDVFETDARMESEIGAFMERTIGQLNGKGFNETVTAIIDTCQSEARHNDNALCKSPICGDTQHNNVSSNGSSNRQLCPIVSNEYITPFIAGDNYHNCNIISLSTTTLSAEIPQNNASSDDITSIQTFPQNSKDLTTSAAELTVSPLSTEQKSLLQCLILMVDHSLEAVLDLIKLELNNKQLTFEEFLNRHQHELYHLCYVSRCCQCKGSPLRRNENMFPSQLEPLFDEHRKIPGHISSRCNNLCCSYANAGITTDVLDLSLARCLLVNCCLDLFWETALAFQGETLEQFLNLNKHIIYHLWKNNQSCCQCKPGFTFPSSISILTENEWRDMFSSPLVPCQNDRKRTSIGPNSICSAAATIGITLQDIHRNTQRFILQHCSHIRKSVNKLVEQGPLDFGHARMTKMAAIEFTQYSNEIENSLRDIAQVCGNKEKVEKNLKDLHCQPLSINMLRRYEKLLHKNIKAVERNINSQHKSTRQSNLKLVNTSSKLKKVEERINELVTSVDKIKEEVKDLSKFIKERAKRQKILDQTYAEIESHGKNGTYVEIAAVKHSVQILESKNVIILSGREGSGKSRNGLEILRQLKEKHTDYEVFKLTGLCDISDIVKCNVISVVLFDDVFGEAVLQLPYDKQMFHNLYSYTSHNKVKVIFVMKNTVIHKWQNIMSIHSVFRDTINVDLNSEDFKLTKVEKINVFTKYCNMNGIRILDVEEHKTAPLVSDQASLVVRRELLDEILQSDPFLGFPECCRLFTEKRKAASLSANFFKYPQHGLVNDIEKLRINGRKNDIKGLTYVVLIYILTNQDSSSENDIYSDLQTCKDIFNVCYDRKIEVNAKNILNTFKKLTCRYLVNRDGRYYFQHQAIKDSILISYSTLNPRAIIPLLSMDHMVDIVRLQNYMEQEDEITINISKSFYHDLANQFLSLLNSCFLYRQGSVSRLIESKIIEEGNEDFSYQLFNCLNSDEETSVEITSDYISNYLPVYLLRTLRKLHKKLLTVNHTNHQLFISVFIGDQNITFSVDPLISLIEAFKEKYEDILEWLLQNTDHLLLDLNMILSEIRVFHDIEYVRVLLQNVNNDMIDMTDLFIEVCGQCHNNEKHIVYWMIDNVDNDLIDYTVCLISLICEVDVDVDLTLHILKKVNHKWLYINEIVEECFAHERTNIIEWILENVDPDLLETKNIIDNIIEHSFTFGDEEYCRPGYARIVETLLHTSRIKLSDMNRLGEWAIDSRWYNILELLLKHDHETFFNADKVLKEAFEQSVGYEDDDEVEKDEDAHWETIVQLIIKYCLDRIDVKQVMKNACQFGMDTVVDILLDKVDNKGVYLTVTLDKLMSQRHHTDCQNFNRGNGRTLMLLLPAVNKDITDLNSVMNDVCQIGHSLAVLWLLEHESSHHFDMRNVMNIACYHGDLELVELLFRKYRASDFDYKTAMIKACRNSQRQTTDVCKWLWKNIDRDLFDMKIALNNASRSDNTKVVEWILAEVDEGLFDTETALLCACEHGEIDTVSLLLDNSGINRIDLQYAITLACKNEYNHFYITRFLYNRAYQSAIDINGVLSDACKYYRTDIIRWIIETCDQNINVTETSDGNKNFIKRLDKNLIDINQALTCILDMDAPGPKKQDADMTKQTLSWLILKKSDPSTIDIHKLLTESCKRDWLEMFRCLLGKVNHTYIQEAVNVACQCGAFNIVKWSLDNIDVKLLAIENVMVESCAYGWLECLVLIQRHCNPNEFNVHSSMVEACTYGRIKIVEWLLQNATNQCFNIPLLLQEACRNGWLNIICWLVKNFLFRSSDLHVATNEALANGHLQIVEWMVSVLGRECLDISSVSKNIYLDSGKEGVVKFILQHFDPWVLDIATVFTNACKFGWKDTVSFIVDNDLSSLCDFALAFNKACDNGETSIVELLLEKVDHQILNVNDAMLCVAVKGWDEIALLLLDHVEHTRLDIGNAFFEACRHGEIDVVQAILQKVEHNLLDVKTALDKACENYMHEELILWILEHIDLEQVDLKTVKKQAIRHKWREVEFAILEVDTEDINEAEQETETDILLIS